MGAVNDPVMLSAREQIPPQLSRDDRQQSLFQFAQVLDLEPPPGEPVGVLTPAVSALVSQPGGLVGDPLDEKRQSVAGTGQVVHRFGHGGHA